MIVSRSKKQKIKDWLARQGVGLEVEGDEYLFQDPRDMDLSDLISDPDMKCGVSIFSTGKCDPFLRCCIIHDIEFVLKEMGLQEKTRKQVDTEFHECMKKIAHDSTPLKCRANLYYALARSLGGIVW